MSAVMTTTETKAGELVSFNPATGEEVGRVRVSSPEDVNEAVARSR